MDLRELEAESCYALLELDAVGLHLTNKKKRQSFAHPNKTSREGNERLTYGDLAAAVAAAFLLVLLLPEARATRDN